MSEAIARVVTDLTEIEARLPDGDGLRTFTTIYLRVTRRVGDRVAEDTFADAAFVERLDVVFAELYFEAERAAARDRPVPKAWEPLVSARRTAGVLPIQHAMAGMNAHINHDLALAVVATCAELGRDPRDAAVRADYERVNDVLAEVVRPIRQSFLDEAVTQVGAPFSPVADAISMWSIDTARDAAWTAALTLRELQRLPWLAEAFTATLARTVGLVSRSLLSHR